MSPEIAHMIDDFAGDCLPLDVGDLVRIEIIDDYVPFVMQDEEVYAESRSYENAIFLGQGELENSFLFQTSKGPQEFDGLVARICAVIQRFDEI